MIFSVLGNFVIGIIGYLIGSISFSLIFSWSVHKEDVRKYGSGNAGATNSTRNYGVREGLIVFILDFTKVLASTLIAWTIRREAVFGKDNSPDIIVQIAPFMALVGHIYPIWHGFRGGKGAACFFGFCLSFNLVVAIIVVLTFIFIALQWKMISLASVITPAVTFVISWLPWFQTGEITFFFRDNGWWVTSFFIFLMALIIVLKHIPNIKKIIKEQESTIQQILKK